MNRVLGFDFPSELSHGLAPWAAHLKSAGQRHPIDQADRGEASRLTVEGGGEVAKRELTERQRGRLLIRDRRAVALDDSRQDEFKREPVGERQDLIGHSRRLGIADRARVSS